MGNQRQANAWAAGFFDGEGCVSLSDCTKKNSPRGPVRHVAMKIIVAQKVTTPLEKFVELFGGRINPASSSGPNALGGRFRGWEWTLRSTAAVDALTKMLPYLTIKREVAEVALDLQSRIDNYPRVGRGCPLSDSEVLVRRSLLEKAKWLNTGRWAAATTKPSGPELQGCDSLDCIDGKDAEVAEMTTRPN
jgi:hypothetical protein